MSSQRVEHSFRESKSSKVFAKNLFDFWKDKKQRSGAERIEILNDILDSTVKQRGKEFAVDVLESMITWVEALLARQPEIHQWGAASLIKEKKLEKSIDQRFGSSEELGRLLRYLSEKYYRFLERSLTSYKDLDSKPEGIVPDTREHHLIRMCQDQFFPLIHEVCKKENIEKASNELLMLHNTLFQMEEDFRKSNQSWVFERAIVETISELLVRCDIVQEKQPELAKNKVSLYLIIIRFLRGILTRLAHRKRPIKHKKN